LTVDGAHHDESHQKQKLREKKQPLRGNLSCQKWLLCILPLQQHPPKLWGQQLKPTLASMFFSVLDGVQRGSCVDSGVCRSRGTAVN
jgi:hypothetical protein